MKVFEGFNMSTKCLICNTNKEGKAVLIPTTPIREDNIAECEQVHLECLDLAIISGMEKAIIFQTIDLDKEKS